MKTIIACLFSMMLFSQTEAQKSSSCNINFAEFSIGEEHNKRVIELYENLNVSNLENGLADIKLKANNFNFSTEGLGVSQADIIRIGTDVSENLAKYNNDVRNWPDAPIKQTAAYLYISQILTEVDNLIDIADFNNKLDIIETRARQNLTCQDLDIVIATIGVTKSSAYLWEPIEIGGYGLFEKKFGKPVDGVASRKSLRDLVGGVIVGDASALSASFIAMAGMLALGLSTPGLNVAILTGLAIDAAIGSACGGFMAWFS